MLGLRAVLPIGLILAAGQAASADVVAVSPDGAFSILDRVPLTTVQQQPWEECYVYFKHDETEGSGPEAAQSFLKLIPR